MEGTLHESDLATIQRAADSVSVWEFQQDHAELASLVGYLRNSLQPLRNYLEIGAGSGLVAKTLDSLLRFDQVYVIDDNYYDFSQRDRRGRLPQAIEWVGDSTTPECRAAVAAWGVTFDFAFIDGCHNGDAPKIDTHSIVPILSDGAFVAFHDKGIGEGHGGITHGVKEWLAEVNAGAVPGLTEEPWRSDHNNTALYRYRRP